MPCRLHPKQICIFRGDDNTIVLWPSARDMVGLIVALWKIVGAEARKLVRIIAVGMAVPFASAVTGFGLGNVRNPADHSDWVVYIVIVAVAGVVDTRRSKSPLFLGVTRDTGP